MALRIALGNNKGGVGKSTLTVQLAAALAETGRRVLVVDMDPQANTSRRLGHVYDPSAPVAGVTEAVMPGQSEGCAAGALTTPAWPEPYADLVDLLPARFDLENRISEAATLGAVGRLRHALADADADHDVTLIDCPPSLGHLTQMGLAAANVALCVVEPEYDAVEGATRFRDFVAQAGAALGNPELRMAGVIVNRVRANLGAHAYQLDGLPDLFGGLVWEPYLPERTAMKDAADASLPLRLVGTSSATEVARLVSELAARIVKEAGA